MNNVFGKSKRPSGETLLAVLDGVKDPQTGQGLAAAGRLSGLTVSPDGKVSLVIEAPDGAAEAYRAVRDAVEKLLTAQPGIEAASVALTAHRAAVPQPRQAQGLAHVGAVLAVASAKGGVGKSTVAVNIACAMKALGLKVGLLDLDVYGPSLPTLLGLAGVKPEVAADKKLLPIAAFGLKTMSIGYIVNPEQAMIWRGAMATNAVRQMLDDVAWGDAADPLDLLVLDLPPGTGDIHLTVAQRLPLDGVLMVSTPQEMALADVRRGAAMFAKVHAPLIGVVENMAWLEQPNGEKLYLFGEGGARRTAQALGAPFLGELPLDIALRESCDAGAPLVATAPDSASAKRFIALAQQALRNMDAAGRPPPIIRFED